MNLNDFGEKLLYESPFYGHVCIGVPKSFSTDIETACARLDGLNYSLHFNKDYFDSLNDKQKIGLIEHEILHIANMHLLYMGNYKDKEIYNIACDMSINQYIKPENLCPRAFLPDSIDDCKMPYWQGVDYYYERLCKSKSEALAQLKDYMKNGGAVSCSHNYWGESQEGLDENIIELIKIDTAQKLKEASDAAESKVPGCTPGDIRSIIDSILKKVPQVLNWKALVNQFNSFSDKSRVNFSRNKLNKRFPGFEAPYLRLKRSLLVGIDVSGSMTRPFLKQIYQQINHISNTGVEVTICEWDAGVKSTYDYKKIKNKTSIAYTGGGGTDPTEAIDYFKKSANLNAAVFFTDGFISCNWDKKLHKPILWIIPENGNAQFSCPGKKVKVDFNI